MPAKQKVRPKRKPSRPRGRVTKLTLAVQKTIVKALMDGNYFKVACALAGVDENTAYEWLARGEGRDPERSPEPEFANFANAVREAEAKAECRGVAALKRKGNPVEFLARRFPDRWATKSHIEHSGPDGGPVLIQAKHEFDGMSDDDLDQYITNREAAIRLGAAGKERTPGETSGAGAGPAGVGAGEPAATDAGPAL